MGLGASMGMMSVRALKCLPSQGLVVHVSRYLFYIAVIAGEVVAVHTRVA